MFIEKLMEILIKRLKKKVPGLTIIPAFPEQIDKIPLLALVLDSITPREKVGRFLYRVEDDDGNYLFDVKGLPVEYTLDIGLWAKNSSKRDFYVGHVIKQLLVNKDYFREFGIEDIELLFGADVYNQVTSMSQKSMDKTYRTLSRKAMRIRIYDYIRYANGTIIDYFNNPIDGTTIKEEFLIQEILADVMLQDT